MVYLQLDGRDRRLAPTGIGLVVNGARSVAVGDRWHTVEAVRHTRRRLRINSGRIVRCLRDNDAPMRMRNLANVVVVRVRAGRHTRCNVVRCLLVG